MHSLIRYSLAATAMLSMAGGVSAHPTAPIMEAQQNKVERPAAVGGGAAAKVANAKALYFLTNDDDNAIAAVELGDNGLITGKGAVVKTGGKGANGIDGTTKEKAAPDALFSQSALTVAGKHIFAVNAGSNTLSMFSIDPTNPLTLQKVGQDIQLPGEFPNTVAASEKNGLVCVGMTGQKAGVACADFSAEGGLGQADGLREFQLNQTTPPVGPTNTVSQVLWSADETLLLATVKGDPEKGNNGFFSAYAVLEADAATAAAENNGLKNLNGSDAAQVKAGKAQDQANKYQNLNASAEAAVGDGKYKNQNQNLNASAEAALGGNKYQNQVKAGKAEAEAEAKAKAEAQKAAQNLYKDKNMTDPAAAAAYANAQQQQQEGGNQANQVKAGKFRVSLEEVRSTPEGTAVLFGSVAIPGTKDVLATDASFGVALLSLLEGALAGNADQAKQKQDQEKMQKEKEKEQKMKEQQQKEKEQKLKEQKQGDKQYKQYDNQQEKEAQQKQKEKEQQQKEKEKQQKEKEQQQKQMEKDQQQKQKQQKQYKASSRLELPGQKATCWATISPLTNTAFVTDVGRNKIIEVGNINSKEAKKGEQQKLSLINEIDLSSIGGPDLGLIDLRAAGEFVYALSPGTGKAGPDGAGADAAINIIHAGTKKFVQNARLAGLPAGKNSMGMAVYV